MVSNKKIYGKDYFEKQLTGVGTFSNRDLRRNTNWFLAQLRYFSNHFDVNFDEADNILEIGCAIAGIAHIFDSKGVSACALDISSYAIKKAKKLSPRVSFKVSDIQKKIPFKDKFDFIFAFEVLEHLDNPLKSLKNIKRRLKKGGRLIVTTPYPFKRYIEINTHVNVLHPRKWLSLMKKAGFKKIKFQPVTFLPRLYQWHNLLGIIFPINSNLPMINSTVFYVAE